jgi:histidinol-phosphatase (PHP family)
MTPFPYNLHSHTVFCDGGNTAEEMAAAAFAAGFKTFGFSGHSVFPWYSEWSMNAYTQQLYLETVSRLKKEYEGKMEIALGIEYDYLSEYPEKLLGQFEYTIGAVHLIRAKDGKLCSIDTCAEETVEGIEHFGGARAFAEEYFRSLVACATTKRTDIVGHFDLVLKYNEKARYIDENEKWYRDLSMSAAAEIAKTGAVFEVNTGAVSRKARSVPYPSAELIKYLNEKGARMTLNSDTHSVRTVDFYFGESLELLRSCGVKELTGYENGKFIQVKI